MTSDNALFDRALLTRRRARASGCIADHDFLLRRVADEIESRLDAMLRAFPVALDLGAHHGLLTERLRRRDTIDLVIGADACGPMLDRSRGARVLCDEEWLPFKDASIDLCVAGLSLHQINDLPGSLVQIRRALKPDGLFLAAALGPRTLTELRESFMQAESETLQGASPRVAPFADVRDYGALLQRAGFALPVADADLVSATYADPLTLMHELRAMGAGNVLHARTRRPLRRATLQRMLEIYGERFTAPSGRVLATFEIVYLTGWAPDESQPKPLRPGSARTRLADALGTREQSAGEKAAPDKA
ncbi:MAG: methyltransferase domain-containing protein [Hyphomicrobiales bacterium]|nr:methyltransferase domain-containing protein [Hyphomicrobiales bacterium]